MSLCYQESLRYAAYVTSRKNMQYTRQRLIIALISCATACIFSLLFFRLVDIQVIQGKKYRRLADDNRFFDQEILPPRGVLLDRYQQPLVWNVLQYLQVEHPDQLYSALQPISRTQALQQIATSGAQAVTTRLQRLYRYPSSLAHAVGYVGEVTAEDLQQQSELKPGAIIGKAGLEYVYQHQLQGISGRVTYEINAQGKKLREVRSEPPQPGNSLATSLDPYLTEFAYRKLGEVQGAVIITDAQTGKVIALTSRPGFDPNLLSRTEAEPQQEQQRKEHVQQLFADERKLFFNRAISGAYPPGSVFKIMTALSGLASGKVDATTQVVDEGVLKVGDYQYRNWYFTQYGRVEGSIGLIKAISRSNDIFFYKVAEWEGPDALVTYARTFGFGSKTHIELPAEARGLMPDPAWKEKLRGEKWYLGDTYHIGIGQGDVLTTPIQIAQMTQAVAHQGQLCDLSVITDTKPNCRQLDVSPEHWQMVVTGMVGACSSGGTAYPLFSYNSKVRDETQSLEMNLSRGAVACKTGTAEFGAADAQGRRKTHAMFTIFFTIPEVTNLVAPQAAASASALLSPTFDQVDALSDEELHRRWRDQVQKVRFPRTVTVTVFLESDNQVPFREGSRDAAPIARQIVDWLTTP